MRIVHSLFTNGIGGTERHLAELVNAQSAQGHDVTVMIRADRKPHCPGPDTFLTWLNPAVPVVRVPRRFPYFAIRSHLKRLQPDIVHTHHRRDSRYFGRAATGIAPVVATLHMPYIEKPFRRHHGIICVSPWQLSDIPTERQPQAAVISNWLNPIKPLNDAEKHELRTRLNLPPGQHIVGAVGRLEHEKGMDVLIRAFDEANLPNCTLCVFGDGEMMPLLEQTIARKRIRNIKLLGHEAEVHKWYAVFDLFVLPSRNETFGLVLLEAMAAGCPITATRNLGALDMLGEDTRICWAQPGDIESLRDAIRCGAKHVGERWDFPTLQRHSLERAVAEVEAFYNAIIDDHSSR